MTLRTLMQAGTAKANELFTRLADTSDGALKTREKLFAELTAELEAHTDLEEQYLFPVLRKQAETKELVAGAIRDNKELRATLAELGQLPKNDETFLARLAELRKAFRQHARDETKAILPAVQRALSDEQVQGITEKMETSLAETEQAKQDQAEEKRTAARRERAQRVFGRASRRRTQRIAGSPRSCQRGSIRYGHRQHHREPAAIGGDLREAPAAGNRMDESVREKCKLGILEKLKNG